MRSINMMISKYNFRKGDASRIRHIVIHYTGSFGTAKDQCQYLAGGKRGRSAHYFVGYEGEIWQSVEDENIAWHCGAKRYKHSECRNANSIGIELCVRKKDKSHKNAGDKDWYFEDATVEAAVELTRYLMQKYSVPASNVLRHYDVTGKVCPAPYVHNTTQHTWEEFKEAVSRKAGVDWMSQIRKLLSEIGKVLGEILKDRKRRADDDQHMTCIMGKPQVSADQIEAYITGINPAAARYARQLADTCIEEGRQEGVRGDIAAASIYEEQYPQLDLVVPVITLIATVTAGVIAHFKFSEKKQNYRNLAESMKSEVAMYECRAQKYSKEKTGNEDQAKDIFVQAIERIIEDGYRKIRELETEQNSIAENRG